MKLSIPTPSGTINIEFPADKLYEEDFEIFIKSLFLFRSAMINDPTVILSQRGNLCCKIRLLRLCWKEICTASLPKENGDVEAFVKRASPFFKNNEMFLPYQETVTI